MLRQLIENCGIFSDVREIVYFIFYFTGWLSDAGDYTILSCKYCTYEFFPRPLLLRAWLVCCGSQTLHAHSQSHSCKYTQTRETETNDPIRLRTAKLGATQEVEVGRLKVPGYFGLLSIP